MGTVLKVAAPAGVADEVAGRAYDIAGIITDDWLIADTPVAEADYYVCGPRPFLRHALSALSLAACPQDASIMRFSASPTNRSRPDSRQPGRRLFKGFKQFFLVTNARPQHS